MAEKSSTLGLITKIVFIGGAIILFALLVIWVVKWVPKAINGVANVGSTITNEIRGGDMIDISVNQDEISSSEPLVLFFDYSPSVAGEYYFSYSCEDSLYFDIQSANGPKRIICNTPFKLGENIDTISILPNTTKQNIFIDTNLKVSYRDYDNEDEIAYGVEIVTIKNTDGNSTASNPYDAQFAGSTVTSAPATPTQTDTTTQRPTNYYGNADLAITNIAETRGYSALSFTVYNYGTRPSGNWYFSYTDAENPNYTLNSPIQPSLLPGQGLFIQVSFDGQRNDNQVINIYADSTNSVLESNESNNRASVLINGDRYYGGGNYDEDDEADLVIEDMEVGRMSGSRFVEDDEIDEDDEAAVRFTVRNKGGESTERWRFEITNTPYDDDDDYRSGRQDGLRPGEEVTIIVEFDNIDEGNYNMEVEVDSEDDVDEERENNNDESERLEVRD